MRFVYSAVMLNRKGQVFGGRNQMFLSFTEASKNIVHRLQERKAKPTDVYVSVFRVTSKGLALEKKINLYP